MTVIASLARRKDRAGKVQMIYTDPPAGVRFASNFWSPVGQRHAKDREADLSARAGADAGAPSTWTPGVHSYLAYLRNRLIVARELLMDNGSSSV